MLSEPIHTCGYIEGVVLNIGGHAYALVEDGVVPLESRFFKDKLKPHPLVSFGGQWYHFRDKGTLIYGANDIEPNLRRYIDNEGRILPNGVKNLESLITAFIDSKARVTTFEHVSDDLGLGKSVTNDSINAIEGEEDEKKLETDISACSELQFAPEEVMPEWKVMQILQEALKNNTVCLALFDVPKFNLKGKVLRTCSRSGTFWWTVVDIALSMASTSLLNWVFSTCRLWEEELGEYFVLPKLDYRVWNNGIFAYQGILTRFIGWSSEYPSAERTNIEFRDENNFCAVLKGGNASNMLHYREENILPILKCLFRVKDHFEEVNDAFDLHEIVGNMFSRLWPCSAIEYVLPYIAENNYLLTSIPERFISKFAMRSPDRLLLAIKKFRYLPRPLKRFQWTMSL